MKLDPSAFHTLFVGCMALGFLVLARYYWRRMRTASYVGVGLAVMMLDYLSNGMRFDDVLTRRVVLAMAIAVGLQIAWDGYKAQRRQGKGSSEVR